MTTIKQHEVLEIPFFYSESIRQMCDLYKLCEENVNDEIYFSVEPVNEEDRQANELLQRHVTCNDLEKSFDLMRPDLAYLRDTTEDIVAIIAEQEKQMSRTGYFRYHTGNRISNVTSTLQSIVQSQYVAMASGAVLGGIIGGPVGFLMGTRIGAMVALSGSTLGALSVNRMQQKANNDQSENDQSTAFHQAML